MPQEILRQSSFNGGELAPAAHGRRDLKAYVSSLALAENLIATAEGPIRRRPGLRHVAMIRGKLQAVELTEAMASAPNGGTAADAVTGAGMTTVANIGATDPYVILEIDFGAPTAVSLIDLTDFALTDGGSASPAPPQYPWERFETLP